MALPTTSLSLSAIQTEFGGSNPISLSEYVRGGSYVPSGTTGAYGTIPTTASNISMGLFRGTQKATVAISNLTLTSQVGSTFNGTAGSSLTFFADGTLFYSLIVTNSSTGRFVRIEYTGGATIASGTTGINGNVSGMWKLSGAASDYQIYVSKGAGALGTYCAITNASFDTWTSMSNNVAISVNTAINDAIDQTFTVQIRSASTSTVLATATIVMNALAAGAN